MAGRFSPGDTFAVMHTRSRTAQRPHVGRLSGESGILKAIPDHGPASMADRPRFSAIGYGRALSTRPAAQRVTSELATAPKRLNVDQDAIRQRLGRNLTGVAPAFWAFGIASATAALIILASHAMVGGSIQETESPAAPPSSQSLSPLAPLVTEVTKADSDKPSHMATASLIPVTIGQEPVDDSASTPAAQPSEALNPAFGSTVVFEKSEPEIARALPPSIWAPTRQQQEQRPSDHLPIPSKGHFKVKVVTVRAKVTAYTAMDHAVSKPEWADGIVAWHPGGKKRRVRNHPYNLATDWSQFPPGATFIRVPGYMDRTFPAAPESFRVVDDACGRSRRDRRYGRQPVIDVRFQTLYSAINGRNGWGMRELDVEVVFPDNFAIPSSIKPWVVGESWAYFKDGQLIKGP